MECKRTGRRLMSLLTPILVTVSFFAFTDGANAQDPVPAIGESRVPESIDRGMMLDAAMNRRRRTPATSPDDPPRRRLRIPERIDRGMMIDSLQRTPR
jgi:hypothetical protein